MFYKTLQKIWLQWQLQQEIINYYLAISTSWFYPSDGQICVVAKPLTLICCHLLKAQINTHESQLHVYAFHCSYYWLFSSLPSVKGLPRCNHITQKYFFCERSVVQCRISLISLDHHYMYSIHFSNSTIYYMNFDHAQKDCAKVNFGQWQV